MTRRPRLPIPQPVLRFFQDCRGVAAIEFAFVAPVLIIAYLGMAELTMGIMAARKTSHLAATIGDLAAQSDNLTMTNIGDLWTIGASMLAPFDTTVGLKMRLTEVSTDANDKATVSWSRANANWTAYANNQAMPQITSAQMSANQSLIMTQVEYDWVSPFGKFLPGTTAFTYTFYHHPRNGAQVTQIG